MVKPPKADESSILLGRRKRPHPTLHRSRPYAARDPGPMNRRWARYIGPTLLLYIFLLIGENTARIALILHASLKHNHCSEDNTCVESRKLVPTYFPKVSQSRAGQIVSILQLPPCLQRKWEC